MLSGLLTAYTIFGRLQAKQSPRILQEYLSRFLRIAPMLGALILFCTFVLPEMGDGPQWNLVINRHADICKVNWWRNMLFIHNYFGFANMVNVQFELLYGNTTTNIDIGCLLLTHLRPWIIFNSKIKTFLSFLFQCLTHTHHLGIDTQLFLISPILILILWKWPRPGLFAMLGMAAFSTVARFHVTVAHQLSNYVYFGASYVFGCTKADCRLILLSYWTNPRPSLLLTRIKQLFSSADLMYSIPLHRATIYIYGILIGYAMRMYPNAKLSKVRWTHNIQLRSNATNCQLKMSSFDHIPDAIALWVVN